MKLLSTLSIILVFLIVSGFSGCEKEILTGMEGTTYRGPINPVAVEGVTNDEAFSAKFYVYDLNESLAGTFISDDDGKYYIELDPGTYLVIPDESSPLLMPAQQSVEVNVPEGQIITLDLYFDTGIR